MTCLYIYVTDGKRSSTVNKAAVKVPEPILLFGFSVSNPTCQRPCLYDDTDETSRYCIKIKQFYFQCIRTILSLNNNDKCFVYTFVIYNTSLLLLNNDIMWKIFEYRSRMKR